MTKLWKVFFPFNNLIKIPIMAKGGNQGDERHNLTSVDITSMHGQMEPQGHWNKANPEYLQ